jgi:hypothetical protein
MRVAAAFLIGMLLAGVSTVPARAVSVQGTILYQKVPATERGLDIEHPVSVPLPGVVVEIRAPDGPTLLAQGVTDDQGGYRLEVPDGTAQARLLVWAVSNRVQVQNPATGSLYRVGSGPIDLANWPPSSTIPDSDRSSGPFNILATLWRANRLLEQIEPGLPLADLPLWIYWSTTRTEGAYQEGPVLYLNGSREEDSDEFDDSMILWLYGSYLLEQFSRSDSPGGESYLGERLDPRLAWHKGWMYFFPQAVLGSPLFVDTYGFNGEETFYLDLDEDLLDEDAPGYWSIYTVSSFLWDVFTPGSAADGHLGLGLGPIWRVMREQFPQQAFPYLISLADGLIQQERGREAGVTEILKRREISYQFGAEPPVPVPFPRQIASGTPVTGRVDSLTSRRTNLLDSAHYYWVQKQSAGPLRIQLALTSEPAPGEGSLQLVLFNAQGAPIKGADSWLGRSTTQAELSVRLPAGSYVIGVLSYRPLRFPAVFSSGDYRLTVSE